MSLIKTWAPYFQSNVRMRGRAYQMAGRVKRVAPADGEVVRAQVRGSQMYQVSIRGEGSSTSVQCTCPVFATGAYCKHIWATIVDVQCNPAGVIADGAPGIDSADPQPPKARRRGDAPRPARRGEPEWVGRLALLRAPVPVLEQTAATVLPTNRQICYALSAELSNRHAGLVVLLRQRDATPSGWGRLKRLRLTPVGIAELGDPIDREFCSLLMGARRHPNRLCHGRPSARAAAGCLPCAPWLLAFPAGARGAHRPLLRRFRRGRSPTPDLGFRPTLGFVDDRPGI